AGFGTTGATWEVTPPVERTHLEILDQRELRIALPPRPEVPGWTMACAWTRDDFVDVDVSAPIVFDSTPDSLGAGIWLRSAGDDLISVMLHYTGAVSVFVEHDRQRTSLASIAASAAFRAGVATVLRARIVRDVLDVLVDGVPRGSFRCPTDV